MKRLVVESDVPEFAQVSGDNVLQKIKSLKVLHFIKQDAEETIMILSVEFKDPKTKLNDVFNEPGLELQVLDRSKGKYTLFMKSLPQSDEAGRIFAAKFWSIGGYMMTPLEVKDGKLKMTFLGNEKLVKVIPSMLKETGIRYKVLELADANLPPSSPLGKLTEKQRRVLTTAYNSGYYDLPRKISSRQLAAKLKIGSSDLIKHRRKAERHVLSAVLNLG
jgi:predicted DNA binding protein